MEGAMHAQFQLYVPDYAAKEWQDWKRDDHEALLLLHPAVLKTLPLSMHPKQATTETLLLVQLLQLQTQLWLAYRHTAI
ncbi:hypothetical protein WJX77_000056 [Trebouxia sp. C0004]